MLKAPQKQTAEDTISTLSSRLASATLLEDRRASILGLRSFAKHYPASVASGSLRELIGCLRTHGAGLGKEGGEGDVDTVRIVLETLLMLFNPDMDSPEASEDIALWLADEFSQRQDNITILLDLLDTTDYYARFYSLQLLTAISSARPERTQECILSAPLGTARLVSVLDDDREAVRDAALLLLVDLTHVSQTELQKLIAFEDAYARIFNLMQAEGGLAEGGIVIQDCLSLLANLIRHSTSNQSLFRESGCVPRLVNLVRQGSTIIPEENDFSRTNREKNVWGLMAVIRLFLERGEMGTKANQDAFWRSGLVQVVLDFAFYFQTPLPIRASALLTCADMIYCNQPLQESFAALQVILGTEPSPQTNGTKRSAERPRTYIIEALLNIVLAPASSNTELRYGACSLIKAYAFGHERIKHHFLQRAIAGYTEGEEDQSNVLSTLMSGPSDAGAGDPLRFVLASDVVAQLLAEDEEAKTYLMGVSEGNAEKGEDVITSTQALSGHLASCLQNDIEPRISVAYLSLLITLLFETQAAVNECLAEGSALLSALISTASRCNNSQVVADPIKSLLPGLSAALLGTIYEFSSKDSPIPRRTLQPFLGNRLGRQRYFDALKQLRQHPVVRDAELDHDSPGTADGERSLFDISFVNWFKEEYGRLRRAIDKDPGIEVVARTDTGVDRDILDELRTQIASKDEALKQLGQQDLEARQKADQTQADHRKELQGIQSSHRSMEAEVERIKRINEALQRDHETETDRLKNDISKELERVQTSHKSATQSTQQQHEREIERLKGQQGASLASERSLWEDKMRKAAERASREQQEKLQGLQKAVQSRDNDLVVLKQDHLAAKTELDKAREEHESLRQRNEVLDRDLQKTKGLQADLQQLNTKALARSKTLEEEGKGHERRVQILLDERDEKAKEIEDLHNKIKELRDEIDGLKLELDGERKGYGELEAELEKIRRSSSGSSSGRIAEVEGDLAAKTKQVESEREEAQKAKTELEDMLMVMSDIEAKRDSYRERLKKLGEDVTDDEDEEEEEDE